MKKFTFTTLLLFGFLTLVILPQISFADSPMTQENIISSGQMKNTTMSAHEGPMFYNIMLHAWVSLLAAIAIFILGLKYMVGGKLSRPIMLMGFGALTDALIGIFFSSYSHLDYMWFGSLAFSLSVVLGIIWMANIFGVFQKQSA